MAARRTAAGGWSGAEGAAPSVEETALAVEALAVLRTAPTVAEHRDGRLVPLWLLAVLLMAVWAAAARRRSRLALPH